MAETFESIWRKVLLHCPLASPMLARSWVQNQYNRFCEFKRWGHLRAEGEFLTNVSKAGTVDVTRGDATVTGVTAGLFASTDAGRQIQLGVGSPYTIESVSGNNCELDRVFGGTTSTTQACTILDAYVTCPEDFGSFWAVLDPSQAWRLHLWVTEHELNRWDASRSSSGTPWALVNRRISTSVSTLDRVQYELWPYVTSAKRYPYYYSIRPQTLVDTDDFTGPLRQRTDIILLGALAEAAEWPGPDVDKRNPYFNLALAQRKREQYERELTFLDKVDDEQYMTWWDTSGINSLPFAPMDANFMQNHDWPYSYNHQGAIRF